MTAADKQGSRFSRNKLGKKTGGLLILGFISVMLVSVGVSQTASVPSVSIGQNGIQINEGGLEMAGTDINDGGTVIWDSSASQLASSAIDFSVATASDVGLGNVENEAQVAESGDTMTGPLTMGDNSFGEDISLQGGRIGSSLTSENDDLNANYMRYDVSDNIYFEAAKTSTSNITVYAGDHVSIENCDFSSGNLDCSGTISASNKNFVQSINDTHEAVYSSQESPDPRAVVEDSVYVDGPTTVELPTHFTEVSSDTSPDVNVQVTAQGKVAATGVLQASTEEFVVDADKRVNVDYRVSAVRDGYEDEQVVREK